MWMFCLTKTATTTTMDKFYIEKEVGKWQREIF